MNNYPRYMNLGTAKNYIGVKSYNTLYKLIRSGLKVVEIDGSKFIDRYDIDEFLDSHKTTEVK